MINLFCWKTNVSCVIKRNGIFMVAAFFSALRVGSAMGQERKPATALVQQYQKYMVTAPPDTLQVDSFYQKHCDAFGIPILSSKRTPDDALLMARDIVNYMLMARPDIRSGLIEMGARVLIIAVNEGEMDLPERRNWKKPTIDDKRLTPGERASYNQPDGIANMTDKQYWNQRARGMGGTLTSCAEENLLGYPDTRYYGEHILVHEFSHNIMNAMKKVDPLLYQEIEKAYEEAKARGLYKGQYAINTKEEYWAEGTQWWFWSNIEFYDGNQRVQSPDDLERYDHKLYQILSRVYGGHHIPADVYYGKNLKPQSPQKQKTF